MPDRKEMDRRRFLKGTAAGVGALALGDSVLKAAEGGSPATAPAGAAVDPAKLIWRSKAATMDYRRLGRTNYMCSRMVAGIGGNDAIWRRMLAHGMNYFDTARGYKGGNHESELSDFFRKNRDQLWITSKATDVAGYSRIDPEVRRLYLEAMKAFLDAGDYDRLLKDCEGKDSKEACQELLRFHHAVIEKQKKTGEKPDLRTVGKHIAKMYIDKLDESLSTLKVDHVDCYMMHGIEIPWIFDCLELWEAYEKAHKAGKTKHFGYSVHKHHKEVLAASVEANRRGPWKIDLIMPGVNPVSLDDLKPELAALKKQDVGIIAMKTSGIKNRPLDGREERFKKLLGGKDYSEYERAKLWMLHLTEDAIDGCIAAMENNTQMEQDLELPMVKLSAEAKRELRAIVELQMAGACHLCGACETNCPKHIAVTDMIRYHAYVHQYDDKELARRLYAMAGYDPAKVCNGCGTCATVCPSHVPITRLLNELSAEMA